MLCRLKIKGKTYTTAEYTERQVSGFIAATIGATGMNVGQLLQDAFISAGAAAEALRRYDSAESAELDLAYWTKKIIPSLDISIDSLGTTDLLNIATNLTELLIQTESVNPLPPPAAPNSITPLYGEELELDHPYNRRTLSESEIHAIGYASREMNHAYSLVECWYQWWKAIDAVEGVPLAPHDAIDLIIEESGNPFNVVDSTRYHTLIQVNLQSIPEPIATY